MIILIVVFSFLLDGDKELVAYSIHELALLKVNMMTDEANAATHHFTLSVVVGFPKNKRKQREKHH